MSWSDDMRCLHCDGKLPLYRKITHGQFCSTAHRKAYWQEQERLAVERLHQTHNSLRACRPVVPAEAILGPTESGLPENSLADISAAETRLTQAILPEPIAAEMSGFVPTLLVPHAGGCPRLLVTDPQVFEMQQSVGAPVWTLPVTAPLFLPVAHAVELSWVPPAPLSRGGPSLQLSSEAGLSVREIPIPICRPVGCFSFAGGQVRLAKGVKMPFAGQAVPASLGFRPESAEPVAVRVPAAVVSLPSASLELLAAPVSEQVPAEEHIPQCDRLFPLAQFTSVNVPAAPISRLNALEVQLAALLPERGSLATAPAQPHLSMGKGRRYPIQFRTAEARMAEPQPADLAVLPPEIALPDHGAEVALQAAEQAREAFVPEASVVLMPLYLGVERLAAKPAPPRALVVTTIPQPLRSKLMLPASKLQPMDPPPSYAVPEMPGAVLAEAANPVVQDQPAHNLPGPKALWAHATGFWQNAPRDLKILLFAIPALLVLAFHPPLPKVHFSSPAGKSGGQITQTLHTAVAGKWANVRQAVFDRAAVALDEDFRSGLDDWTSRGDATAEWSFDATGFVQPGPLALYRPSMNLRDYQMQFMGLIDKKALSWVVRAVDFDNYYVVKMVVLKPGPLTTLGITRYAVINGKAENRSDTIVPIDARPDMLYRVTMDVHDDTFALTIQGQMTDSWSEPRLPKGGIGFFNARGEESRVRWVQVTHQYDMLGRLCAYLAPYDIPTTNGSW